jgi:L-iditol 2-dehydrogenase
MRAALYRGPGDLRVEDRRRPSVGPGEALLKVFACGVCGTDRRIVAGGHRLVPPGTIRVLGHEIIGEIVEAGEGVSDLPSGAVFVAPNFGCGSCAQCLSGNNNRCSKTQALGITLDGGFADFLLIPAAAIAQGNVIPLGDGLDAAEATLIEPLACVIRGQEPLEIGPADIVLIVGAGPIGVLHLMLARLRGAGKILIADRHAEKLAFAKARGADVTIDVSTQSLADAVKAATNGGGVDVAIVAAPSPEASAQVLELCATGGRVSWFAGLPKDRPTAHIDPNVVHYRELRVSGTTACSTLDCKSAATIVKGRRLDLAPLLTRRLPLGDAPLAFAPDKDPGAIKTVLVP